MANEITLSIDISYAKGNVEAVARTLSDLGITVTGSRFVHNTQLIGTAEEALQLGELTGPFGIIWAHNLDSTNYLEYRSGTGAANDVIKFLAGEIWVWRSGSDVTAPFAIANTASCYFEYMIFEI